ncbi:NAD-dependent epimerase/dehydratase [Candidatus Magnetomorum sp. HK-1]|nr:NAD-dependent epimerase/dehydratase [Candidatus Magnetomorum sp. HK-1]
MNTHSKVLILGGAGYIGCVLTNYLLSKGYLVRSFDNFIYNHQHSVYSFLNHPNYEIVYGDHRKSSAVVEALKNVDHVIILSGLVGDPITKKYPEISEKINFNGVKDTIGLLSNNKTIKRVIFVSTCSNYGLIPENISANENFKLNPLSLYAKAKVNIEKYILSLQGNVDFHPTILRFSTAFGLSSRMRFDLTINEFTHDLFFGKELLVYDPETWRPYCHVNDFAVVIQKVLEAQDDQVSFQVFNAGGDINNYTKQMIVDTLLSLIPEAKTKVKYKKHGSDPRNYRVDFSKIKNTLNFEPTFSVLDGIKEILAALDQHLFDFVDENRNSFGNYRINIEK